MSKSSNLYWLLFQFLGRYLSVYFYRIKTADFRGIRTRHRILDGLICTLICLKNSTVLKKTEKEGGDSTI